MRRRLKIGGFQIWMAFLSLLILGGLAAGGIVFAKGLVVTNLTDLVPWGLWITIDVSSIALGAGAFLLCAAVYILDLKHLRPVARTATFVGLCGYTMALFTLLLDIGRPDRFWHALVYWNSHSLLWEICMCITLYLGVLLLETLPILGGSDFMQQRWPRLAGVMQKVHHIAPVLAVVGLGLSMLHQSSLGALYGVIKARPIWFRPGLSILFIISAMAGGPALTVFASMLSSRLTSKAFVKDELLDQVSKFIGWVLVAYLYFRFWDALSVTYTSVPGRNEGFYLLTRGSLALNFWFGEILFGIVGPMVVLLNNRMRAIRPLRMLALALVAVGLIFYRWDTNLVGQLVVLSYIPQEIVGRFTSYTPSWIEVVSGAGVIAYGLALFTLGVRYLKIVDHREEEEVQVELEPRLATSAAD